MKFTKLVTPWDYNYFNIPYTVIQQGTPENIAIWKINAPVTLRIGVDKNAPTWTPKIIKSAIIGGHEFVRSLEANWDGVFVTEDANGSYSPSRQIDPHPESIEGIQVDKAFHMQWPHYMTFEIGGKIYYWMANKYPETDKRWGLGQAYFEPSFLWMLDARPSRR